MILSQGGGSFIAICQVNYTGSVPIYKGDWIRRLVGQWIVTGELWAGGVAPSYLAPHLALPWWSKHVTCRMGWSRRLATHTKLQEANSWSCQLPEYVSEFYSLPKSLVDFLRSADPKSKTSFLFLWPVQYLDILCSQYFGCLNTRLASPEMKKVFF